MPKKEKKTIYSPKIDYTDLVKTGGKEKSPYLPANI